MCRPTYTREEFLKSCITPATSSPFISTECSICQEPYRESTGGCAVTFSDKDTCNHVFCRACITAWLSMKSVNTCALCRRVLFALENHPSIYDDEYGDSDDDEEDDEDYGEEEDECDDDEELNPLLNSEDDIGDVDILQLRIHTTGRDYILPGQIILEILENIWFKTWWLLECYRCYVFHACDSSLNTSSWRSHRRITDAQAKALLPATIELIHVLFSTIRALGVDSMYLYGDFELKVIEWLVQDIAASLKAHIDITDGRNRVPDFPLWRMRIWGEPLQWLLALPKDSGYTRVSTPLSDGVN